MTQDEIMEMARQAGFAGTASEFYMKALGRFANLVAAKEREACAKLIDEEALDAFTFDDSLARSTENYAELIRARGEQA